ncbi:MAG: ribosome-associated translation inhibitor RaiA [Pseudomonadota bacterium]
MDVQVTGKNMDLGAALQAHVDAQLTERITKYFGRGAEATVIFERTRHLVECETTAHLASGVFLSAHGDGGDAYGAFDAALEKLEKRVRRYKRRLKNHHAQGKDPLPAESASMFVVEPSPEDDKDDPAANGADTLAPVVIAESQTQLREMTAGDAVMQLDLADEPAIVFKNAAHGRVNVVYRRRDGHIGWIDPAA